MIFITGTGTGVGKTYITTLLAKYWLGKNKTVAVVKPVSTGVGMTDPEKYRRINKLAVFCFYNYRLPLSPYQAFLNDRRSNVYNHKRVVSKIKEIMKSYDVVLVEGVGGVMVPLNKGVFAIDIAADLRLPTVLVTTPWLGTLNHTILSVEVIKRTKVDLRVVVVNATKRKVDKYHRQIPELLRSFIKIPVVGIVPFSSKF